MRASTFLVLLVISINGSAFAAMDAMIANTQAAAEAKDGAKAGGSGGGVSRTALFSGVLPKQEVVRVSGFAMFSGPGLNNLDLHQPAHEGGHGRAHAGGGGGGDSGYSARYLLSTMLHIAPRMHLGPVLEASQKFTGDKAGAMSLGDPQLKLSVSDVGATKIRGNDFKSMLWVAAYAPLGEMSRASNTKTAFSVGIFPRLAFHGSRFSLSGLALMKVSLVGREAPESGLLYPGRLFGGVQGSYDLTARSSAFLMAHSGRQLGPNVPISDPGLSSMMLRYGSHNLGWLAGMNFNVTDSLMVSPRLSWFTDQGLGDTTVGVNASMQLI